MILEQSRFREQNRTGGRTGIISRERFMIRVEVGNRKLFRNISGVRRRSRFFAQSRIQKQSKIQKQSWIQEKSSFQ